MGWSAGAMLTARRSPSQSPSVLVGFLLLVAVAVSIGAPLLDHHAAERDPGHSHLLGGRRADAAYALGAHAHAYERPHSHPPTGGTKAIPLTSDGLQLMVIASADGAIADAGINAQALLVPPGLPSLVVPLVVGLFVSASRRPVEALVAVPEIPPRA